MNIHHGNATQEQRSHVEAVIHRSVYCQSMLIEDLMKKEMNGFLFDDAKNLFEPKCPDCGETAAQDEDGVWRCDSACGWESNRKPDTEPVEVCEWYLITDSWVADKLKKLGQPMLDNDYGTWWGRTCTGQAILLDPTFWTICQDHLPKE